MTDVATLLLLSRLRDEFEYEGTAEDRRKEILTKVQEFATESTPGNVCTFCRKVVVYIPYTEALIPGHIYSEDGVREYRITQMCEHCFDEATKEPDEDDIYVKKEND
jgi:hypothetical protein